MTLVNGIIYSVYSFRENHVYDHKPDQLELCEKYDHDFKISFDYKGQLKDMGLTSKWYRKGYIRISTRNFKLDSNFITIEYNGVAHDMHSETLNIETDNLSDMIDLNFRVKDKGPLVSLYPDNQLTNFHLFIDVYVEDYDLTYTTEIKLKKSYLNLYNLKFDTDVSYQKGCLSFDMEADCGGKIYYNTSFRIRSYDFGNYTNLFSQIGDDCHFTIDGEL